MELHVILCLEINSVFLREMQTFVTFQRKDRKQPTGETVGPSLGTEVCSWGRCGSVWLPHLFLAGSSSRTDPGSHRRPRIPSSGRYKTANDIASQIQCFNNAETTSGTTLVCRAGTAFFLHCSISCILIRCMTLGLEITWYFWHSSLL